MVSWRSRQAPDDRFADAERESCRRSRHAARQMELARVRTRQRPNPQGGPEYGDRPPPAGWAVAIRDRQSLGAPGLSFITRYNNVCVIDRLVRACYKSRFREVLLRSFLSSSSEQSFENIRRGQAQYSCSSFVVEACSEHRQCAPGALRASGKCCAPEAGFETVDNR